jgi:beta-xylosidase
MTISPLPNPLIPGFNPDPSILRVGDDFYLVTSSFEYLPGLPIYHSRDLVNWKLINHVVTRPGQLQLDGVPTGGSAWAPTIRIHDGIFYVVVTDAMGRGTLIFTATDPAGEWSDGIVTDVEGIDPDLAWDSAGNCYVTFSVLFLRGSEIGKHLGIQQARIDLKSGKMLEAPRQLWSGTGLMFPEAPHLYQIGDWWYLMIAEGGTERGHSVSIARSKSPEGPFEGCPSNPVLSARSTKRPIQSTGHGDLVLGPDDEWYMVLLGTRTRGHTRAFSSHGRETFITSVEWVDGWPVVAPVEVDETNSHFDFLADLTSVEEGQFPEDFSGEFVAVRRTPRQVLTPVDGGLKLVGNGLGMDDPAPSFVGRRQCRFDSRVELVADFQGIGGLTLRYDEQSHYDIEVTPYDIVVRARLYGMTKESSHSLPDDLASLFIQCVDPVGGFEALQTSDLVQLGFINRLGERSILATFDGRYLSAEVTTSFTGRVYGVYCTQGSVTIRKFSETTSNV